MGAAALGNVKTIDDVVAVMRALDASLPDSDGVKWFNFLYLGVTEAVRAETAWQDGPFLERFDVVFANLYFDALANWDRVRSNTPHAWRPLFKARHNGGLARAQFAFAGMNAHINHDLAIALERMAAPDGRFPMRDGARHRDFQHVNDILERAETTMRAQLATGLVAEIDRELADLDSAAALWKVRKAREAAWTNGEVLWQLRGLPRLRNEFAERLDRMTELAGHGLLLPRLG